MEVGKLPNLLPAQVVELQHALLANADGLLTSALAVLDLGHLPLADSLAILGPEESGKAIAIHERRVPPTGFQPQVRHGRVSFTGGDDIPRTWFVRRDREAFGPG